MGKFIFLMDFVILDMDDRVEVPLILGIPFLATLQSLIDVKDGQMVLQVDEEEITFRLKDSIWHSMDFDDTCYYMDVVDILVGDYVQDTFMKDELSELLGEVPPDKEPDKKLEEVFHKEFSIDPPPT